MQSTPLRFYWDTMLGSTGSTLTATSTESSGDYDVDYLYNMLEVNLWKAEDTSLADPQHITYDAGSGNTEDADYLAIIGHNLNTAGASVRLQYSSNGWDATGSDLISNGGFDSDATSWTASGCTLASIAGGQAGNCLELTYASGSSQTASQVISGLTVGKTYRFTGYVKSGSSGDEAAVLLVYDGANFQSTSLTSSGTWQTFSDVVFDAQATSVTVYFQKNTATAGTMLFDTATFFEIDAVDVFSSDAPTADTVYLKEFTSVGAKRYWRLKIEGHGSTAPYMAICIWGVKTEIAYIQPPFDPYSQRREATINRSYGGYVTGVHNQYIDRNFNINITSSASTTVYTNVKTWWETHGLQNFFMKWDSTGHSTDIYLVRANENFDNPITGDFLRNISISLTGRKE